jgi:hypothetical protein
MAKKKVVAGAAGAEQSGQSPAKAVFVTYSGDRLTSARSAGGVSNTPHSNIENRPVPLKGDDSESQKRMVDVPVVNTSVDYLKVRFSSSFSVSETKWEPLWKVLRVDPSVFKESHGGCFYILGVVIDEGTSFFWGGNYTKDADGNDTCLLEMKGQGCRLFETRVLSEHPGETDSSKDYALQMEWMSLVDVLHGLGGVCTRIDLPTDDFSDLVPFEGLQKKLETRTYRSSLRSFKKVFSFPDDCDSGCFIKKKNGYTVTLGSRESVELCVYDKRAERIARGFEVNVSSWVRFEVRYYHESAVSAFDAFRESLHEEGSPASFIFSLLNGIFCPLENKVATEYYSVNVWKPWAYFMQGQNSRRIFGGARVESDLATNRAWLKHDASKAMARVCAYDPLKSLEVFRFLLNDGFSKLDEKDLAIINAGRTLNHLCEFSSVAELLSYVSNHRGDEGVLDILSDLDPEVASLFADDARKAGLDDRVSSDSFGLSDHDDPFKGGKGGM